jgi:hypothetical protein
MKTMMKKQFRLMTACLAAATMIFASCGDDDSGNETPVDKKVTSVTVTPAAVSLAADGTQQLSATVAPADAADKTVRWTSSPTGWVSEGGLVTVPTGTAAGTIATITATAGDGGGAKGTCTVTVTATTPTLTFTDDAAFDIPASVIGTAIAEIDIATGASGGTAPYTFGATGLPAGIAISAAGVISGTPTTVATAGTATVTVKDSSSPAQEKSVTIAYGAVTEEEEDPDPVTYSIGAAPQALVFGALQTPYTQPAARTVTVTNTGTGAVTLSQPTAAASYTVGTLSATELDAGATASFTVRPNAGLAAGTYNATITINGNNDVTATVAASFEVTVTTPALAFTDAAAFDIPASTVGTAIANIDVATGASGGTAPYTFSATGLPAGITISAAGVISGTPTIATAAGTATVTVRDSSSPAQEKSITIDCGKVSAAVAVPGAVGNFTATAGDGRVDLTWTAPASNGGSPIVGYEVTRDNWVTKEEPGATELNQSFAGLTNGTEYTFRIRALNAAGAGAESTVKATPAGKPGIVRNFTATPGNRQVTLNWSAPANDGGSPITGYRVILESGVSHLLNSDELIFTATGLTNGTTYTFGVRAVNARGEGTASMEVATPVSAARPVITAHPQDASTTVGGTVTFSITATGATSYKWQISNSGTSWTDVPSVSMFGSTISGEKTPTLTLVTTRTAISGRLLRCVATNAAGSTNSNSATITVTEALTYSISASPATLAFGSLPVGYTQPTAQTVTITNTGTGNVTLSPLKNPVHYTFGTLSATELAAGAKATFTVRPRAGLAARNYDLGIPVSGSNGASASVAATFEVTEPAPTKPTITSQPADQTVAAGGTATFGMTATGATSYKWFVSTDGGTMWGNVADGGSYSGATTATLTISNAPAGYDGYRYRGMATNAEGSIYTDVVTLNVLSPPVITAQPTNKVVMAGATTTFSITATGATSYQWQSSQTGGADEMWSNVGNTDWFYGSTTSGATTATLTISKAVVALHGRRFRCVATGAGGSTTSGVAQIAVPGAVAP